MYFLFKLNMYNNSVLKSTVAYLDQGLGALHSKHWLKFASSHFCTLMCMFLQNYEAKMEKNEAKREFFDYSQRLVGTNTVYLPRKMVKTYFQIQKLLKTLIFHHFCIKTLQKHEKSTFQPAFGVPSTQKLFKIYNNQHWTSLKQH